MRGATGSREPAPPPGRDGQGASDARWSRPRERDPINLVRWNLSRRAPAFRKADAFLVSFPKSGRTWVRVLLHAYMAAVDGRAFSLDVDQLRPGRFPRVLFTHDRFEHRALGNWWSRLHGKHLIPGRDRRTKPVVLLVRDPRDVA